MANGSGPENSPFENFGGPSGGGSSDLNFLGIFFEKPTTSIPVTPEQPPERTSSLPDLLAPGSAQALSTLIDLRSLSSFSTINDIIDPTDGSFSNNDRGYLYGIDPVSGNVRTYPTSRTSLWTADDADQQRTLDQRGFSYGVDPLTGGVRTFPNRRTDLWTQDDANHASAIEQRGYYFALDPWSGRISRFSSRPQLE